MTSNLLRTKLAIEERNGQLLARVRNFSFFVQSLKNSPFRVEFNFKARCLERLYTLMKLTADNCFAGMPIASTLTARGVIETAGLIVLFESKMQKLSSGASKQRLETVKTFVFSTKKFSAKKKAVHVLDCVRALKPIHSEVELLYDILCESVHPNWLGVSFFKDFQPEDSGSEGYDELIYSTVFQSLILAHKVVGKLDLPVLRL